MKRTPKSVKNAFLSVLVSTLCIFFVTSCFIGGFDPSDIDTNPDYQDDVVFPGEHTNPNEMKNVILNVDFDNNSTHQVLASNARKTTDALFAKWKNRTRPNDALVDRHRRVYELSGLSESSISIDNIKIPTSSTLTFQFRSDVINDNALMIAIKKKGNISYKSYTIGHKGYGENWREVSVPIPDAGTYKIKFYIPAQPSSSPDLLNVIYIDNLTIAPDIVEYIDIYPKGLQETYVGGNPIKFTADPLRGDRTQLKKDVSYSVTGNAYIDQNGVLTPYGEGQCCVTVSVDGKTVRKENIYVHKEDYLYDSVKIGNYEFTGQRSTEKYIYDNTGNILNYKIPRNLKADGFFVLEGKTKVPLLVRVEKTGTDLHTSYLIRKAGAFKKRIWLRFGKGEYNIYICEVPNMPFHNTQNPNYEGDIKGNFTVKVNKSFKIENTNYITEKESLYLLPSELVQSDDFRISNLAHSIVSDLPSTSSSADVLRSIHDRILDELYYDTYTLTYPDRRKRQDALHTYEYGMGVCEGYSNLFAALARSVGIKTKCVGSKDLNHAWNQVWYKNDWYLVDATWDDPVVNSTDINEMKAEGRENYTFFMTGLTDGYYGEANHHTDEGVPDTGRSVISEIPVVNGMPSGWY